MLKQVTVLALIGTVYCQRHLDSTNTNQVRQIHQSYHLITQVQPVIQGQPRSQDHLITQGHATTQGHTMTQMQSITQGQPITQGPTPINQGRPMIQGQPISQGMQSTRARNLSQNPFFTQGEPMTQDQVITQGSPISQGQPISEGQKSARSRILSQNPFFTQGQPMTQSYPITQGTPVGQGHPIIQGQQGQGQQSTRDRILSQNPFFTQQRLQLEQKNVFNGKDTTAAAPSAENVQELLQNPFFLMFYKEFQRQLQAQQSTEQTHLEPEPTRKNLITTPTPTNPTPALIQPQNNQFFQSYVNSVETPQRPQDSGSLVSPTKQQNLEKPQQMLEVQQKRIKKPSTNDFGTFGNTVEVQQKRIKKPLTNKFDTFGNTVEVQQKRIKKPSTNEFDAFGNTVEVQQKRIKKPSTNEFDAFGNTVEVQQKRIKKPSTNEFGTFDNTGEVQQKRIKKPSTDELGTFANRVEIHPMLNGLKVTVRAPEVATNKNEFLTTNSVKILPQTSSKIETPKITETSKIAESPKISETPKLTKPPKPTETDESKFDEAVFKMQAENAKYSFASESDDSINSNFNQRQEVRDGLNVKGKYSFSDGYYRRTVQYEADEKGYRVIGEEVEPIGSGPLFNPDGEAKISSFVDGNAVNYRITKDDIQEKPHLPLTINKML